MKFKLIFLSFIGSLSLSAITAPLAVAATSQEKAPRWFEVEVILFKQLGDKKLLKEQFPVNAQLPSYNKYVDLITPFLQPNIASLKQQLSHCETTSTVASNTEIITDFVALKSLTDIDKLAVETVITDELVNDQVDRQVADNIASDETSNNTTNQQTDELSINQSLSSTAETYVKTNTEEEPKGLTKQQLSLLTDAEQAFSAIQFITSPQYPYFPEREFCLVDDLIIQQILLAEQQTNGSIDDDKQHDNAGSSFSANSFTSNSFPVSKVPTTIKASGLRDDSKPYLISKNSLLLKDVITRLKWSKNFKPLLHLGWRQIGITRKKAIPFKIIAGEHLAQTYQQAVNEQEALQRAEQQALLARTNAQTSKNMGREPATVDEDTLQQQNEKQSNAANELAQAEIPQQLTFIQQQQAEQLEAIFEQLALIDDNSLSEQGIEKFLASANSNSISTDVADVNNTKIGNTDTEMKTNIEQAMPPVQPWLLDGFFKMSLDHYLYITADLNIVGAALNAGTNTNEQVSKNSPFKAINFSQNRRVISGEVHYFDHPYIGMVVQIRRFDPSKPDDEAVTQAIR